jgi:probable blue pigment (indigoidine) exporter
VPVALLTEPALPPLSVANWTGFLYLGLIGAALTYILWFRGLARIEPAAVSTLGFLSPTMAVILGWAIAGQALSALQMAGIAVVLFSTWLSQQAQAGVRPAKLTA